MLKKRLIPTLLFKNHNLVKGKQFKSDRGVGTPLPAVKIYNLREVDELIFLDVNATNKSIDPNYEVVKEISSHCFVPLTVGGGVNNLYQIESLLKNGADKVSINTQVINDLNFLKEACKSFGQQCITVSIDYKSNNNKEPIVWINSGKKNTHKNLFDVIKMISDIGAGEFLVTSIDHDGTFNGFDKTILKRVTEITEIPVIGSGGAGKIEDFSELILFSEVSAVAAASIFHFTEITPLTVKKYMKSQNIKIRI